jgi:hypothetical protein
MFIRTLIFIAMAMLPTFAAEITGTATNKTTGKPAGGDDVILLKLAEGMQEIARTKTDASGRFKLAFQDDGVPHLVRVNHGKVNYHRPAPPGTLSVEVDVFDAAENVAGIAQTVNVMRIEAGPGSMRVIQMFAVQNSSSPPRTQLRERNFEIALPEGAQLEQTIAAGPGGMPVTSAPVPTGAPGGYAFVFPLRPGETRFQLSYTLPYNGSATMSPKVLQPTENFAVSVPLSMQVQPSAGSRLERKGEDAGMAVYVAQNANPGDPLGFTVSGTGTVPIDGENQAPAANDGRPGGGLGTPMNTPDPLYQYRWWIIGGVVVLLVTGAAVTLRGTSGDSTRTPGYVLDVVKEEMFELEKDKLAQRVTDAEYLKVKAALETVLARAMSRARK